MSKNQAVSGQAELFSIEDETAASVSVEIETAASEAPETEPSAADMVSAARLEQIVNGYSDSQWVDIMLAADSYDVGMSRGVAAERLFISKQQAKRERLSAAAAAIAERDAETAAAAAQLAAQRRTKTYAAMTRLLSALRSRGVVMTLKGRKVYVESVQWSKSERKAVTELVATFTFSAERYSVTLTGSKSERFNLEQAVNLFTELLPERPADVMPRKYRDIMRTHRHKNMTPSDITGNRAARSVDGPETASLSAADIAEYAAAIDKRLEGEKRRTTGKRSMQGVKLTAAERRESDRERLKAWRAARKAEKLAAEMLAMVPSAAS